MDAFGAVSYAALGTLYLVLTLMLVTSWRGPRIAYHFVAACLVTAAWAGTLAGQIASGDADATVVFFAEVARAAAWLAFLAHAGLGRKVAVLAHLAWIVVLVAGVIVLANPLPFGAFGSIDRIMIPGGLLIALVGLIVIEQLFRNSPQEHRRGVKALVLALGGMYAYDLYLYSQGLLFNELDATTWYARGAANILFVPLIVLAARRNPLWQLNVFVSRQVVFYSTALVAVGAYLVVMSIGGYLLLLFGGNWGAVARIVFFVGAVLVLLTLVFSSVVRAKVKVFLAKHFYSNKYDYREEWLRLVSTLAEFEDSSTRQVVIRAMAQIVGSPAGVLWTRTGGGQAFSVVATWGGPMSVPDLDAAEPLVAFIDREGWLVDLREYAREPDRYENLPLPEWLEKDDKAWIIVPLMLSRQLLGMVLLYEPALPGKLNYEDRDLLKTVGSHIAVHLAQEKADTLLARAQQFEAYNRLTAFLMHDLKNVIAQQSLIVENAEKHRQNPAFVDDAFATIAASVARMRKVMEHLRQTSVAHSVERVELSKLIMQVASECESARPAPRAEIGDSPVWVKADRDRLFMALNHAVRNSQDATPDDGSVTIRLVTSNGIARIEIEDTGCGMDEAFVRERLFKPFDSTKGTKGVGIGAYQLRETIRAAGGNVRVRSGIDRGTTVTIDLNTMA